MSVLENTAVQCHRLCSSDTLLHDETSPARCDMSRNVQVIKTYLVFLALIQSFSMPQSCYPCSSVASFHL